MATVTVVFNVDDKHIGRKTKGQFKDQHFDEYKKRLHSELSRIQPNSECGLILNEYTIETK